MNAQIKSVYKRIFIISLIGLCNFSNYMQAHQNEADLLNDQVEQTRSAASKKEDALKKLIFIMQQQITIGNSKIIGSDSSASLSTIQDSITTLTDNLDPILPELTAITATLATVTTDLESITTDLGTITSELATETQVNNLGTVSDTSGIHTSFTALATDITTATSSLATATNLSTLQTTANTINANVSTMAAGTTLAAVQSALTTAITTSKTTLQGSNSGATITAIEGTGFTSGTDDLHSISSRVSVSTGTLATSTNLSTLQTTANTINTHITDLGRSSDVSALYQTLALVITSLGAATPLLLSGATTSNLIVGQIGLIQISAVNAALTTTLTVSAGSPATYNTDIATALTAVGTATTTPSSANTISAINDLATAITDFNAVVAAGGIATSSYTFAQINSALIQLAAQLAYLDSLQP